MGTEFQPGLHASLNQAGTKLSWNSFFTPPLPFNAQNHFAGSHFEAQTIQRAHKLMVKVMLEEAILRPRQYKEPTGAHCDPPEPGRCLRNAPPYEHFIVKKIIFSPPAVQRTPDGLPAPARQTGRKLDF